MALPEKLQRKLNKRSADNSLRTLAVSKKGIDFCSNDYLGFAQSEEIYNATHASITENKQISNGATGSRLISGNKTMHLELESYLATTHESEAALLYNSGYDANVGFFSCVPQRNDVVFYDELIHASIRDGIRLSHAKAYSYQHNALENLVQKIEHLKTVDEIYVVTESIFSMDGDAPNLKELVRISKQYNCKLIIDEAHALGVFGLGLAQETELFARIITFGKGLGCHGAVVLGSHELKNYLVNFSHSFIYTTALPVPAVVTIQKAYEHLTKNSTAVHSLKRNITCFKDKCHSLKINHLFTASNSAIQSYSIPGNNKAKLIANKLLEEGFNVKAILSPTVAANKERIRFCIHSYNTEDEISHLLTLLEKFGR